jgi:UDP-N-acetylmuramoylalanine--D-glutamate ligase
MKTPWSDSDWNRVLVYGLGLSGRAAVRLLLDHGVEVIGVDGAAPERLDLGDLKDAPGFTRLASDPAGADGADGDVGDVGDVGSWEPTQLPEGIDAVVLSPGVPPERPLLQAIRRADLPVIAEVELAVPFLDGELVGITGSNGKSTTTALAAAMLRGSGFEAILCGNIGTPLTRAVLEAGPVDPHRRRIYVVELSSFQLEEIDRLRPRAAAFLNLAADHLDRYADGIEGYTAAKRRLFENQTEEDIAVLNADDPVSAGTDVASRRRLFSLEGPVDDGCWLDGDVVREVSPGADSSRELFARAAVPLAGTHNVANAMAAALLALAVGATPEGIASALPEFTGLPHRLERVAEVDGVVWYDDSKGTNPAATLGSLKGMADGSVHLILGGRAKGSDFTELAEVVAAKARRLYLIGEAGPEIGRSLAATRVPAEDCGTLERAVEAIDRHGRSGEVALLSPACASFDQFRDFNHRGDVFKRLVDQLALDSTRGVG